MLHSHSEVRVTSTASSARICKILLAQPCVSPLLRLEVVVIWCPGCQVTRRLWRTVRLARLMPVPVPTSESRDDLQKFCQKQRSRYKLSAAKKKVSCQLPRVPLSLRRMSRFAVIGRYVTKYSMFAAPALPMMLRHCLRGQEQNLQVLIYPFPLSLCPALHLQSAFAA